MPAVRPSVALRATLLLVLALVCGTCVLPGAAGPAAPAPQQPRLQQPAAVAAYESAHSGGSEADAPRGSAVHRDRRRAAASPTGPPGPPPLVARAAPRTDPSATRPTAPESRPRPPAAHDSSALQVFLC
ncbi:hypothetical protein ACF09C_27485 [Streptomyces sp. NPDC014870]|uniref:hypothetical protein n=1 Tax=Streptomyces sp. NPDC014870 TaxID=3364925 RepID=UPI0036FA3F54